MKREYQKPELYYESFQLAQSIAANCEGIANFAENACSVTLDGPGYSLTLFHDSQICVDSPPNPDDFVCYHAPAENMNVFSS